MPGPAYVPFRLKTDLHEKPQLANSGRPVTTSCPIKDEDIR